jgi:hypothetical protein
MNAKRTMTSATRALGTLAVISVLVIGAAASANAASSAAPVTQSVAPVAIGGGSATAARQILAITSAPSGTVTAANVIVCRPNVQNPHNSSHVRGTVNVVVTLKCTAAVRQINIRAALYFNGRLVKQSGQRTFNNTGSAQNNAAVPCRNGTYQGWMSYGVLFPPRYVPPTGAGSGFGRAVRITC